MLMNLLLFFDILRLVSKFFYFNYLFVVALTIDANRKKCICLLWGIDTFLFPIEKINRNSILTKLILELRLYYDFAEPIYIDLFQFIYRKSQFIEFSEFSWFLNWPHQYFENMQIFSFVVGWFANHWLTELN